MTASTSTAHSVPPEVILEAVGRDRDIPVITLDLGGDSAIDRSIVRRIASALFRAHRTFLLASVAATRPGEQDVALDAVMDVVRHSSPFQVDLTHDAAQALYEQLGRVLEQADTTCASEGCHAIAVIDGHCAADDERLDRRIGA